MHAYYACRYDLYDVEIKPETTYEEQLRSGMSYAPEGHFYVTLSLEEELFEGTNSIRYVGPQMDGTLFTTPFLSS